MTPLQRSIRAALYVLWAAVAPSCAFAPLHRGLLPPTASVQSSSGQSLKIISFAAHLGALASSRDLNDVDEEEVEAGGMQANPLYGWGQIQHAIASLDDKRLSEEENESRRRKKVGEWLAALNSTNLSWGSRQAIAEFPVWATPRVLGGGFVSGELLAQLQDGEVSNDYYLTVPGLVELDRLLKSGCYRVRVPEHGALLTVAWLLGNDQGQEAQAVLDEITPYFHRLRFYPDKADTPLVPLTPSILFLSTVGNAMDDIRELVRIENSIHVPRSRKKIAQRRAIEDWLPLKWELLALWAETCVCGVPGETFPDDWCVRAARLMEDFDHLAARDKETNRGRTKVGSTKDMVSCIKSCCAGGIPRQQQLSNDDKDILQNILSGTDRKHGLPGSTKFAEFQKEVQKGVPQNETRDAMQLIDSLAKEDPEIGLSTKVIQEITYDCPGRFRRPVLRTQMGSLKELIDAGLVPSSELVAALVPKLMAQSLNSDIVDEPLRRLACALDVAFSARRSVLLFNLQSQVRFEELPWAQPILQHRGGESAKAMATLKLVVQTTLEAFPQTILPNKLLQSLRPLVKAAGLDIPLTDELAADIFMGAFSEKFTKSAHMAADLMKGSLYERYFGLDYEKVKQTDSPLALYSQCGSVKFNQHLIEQQQIMTTHNLAVCYSSLGLDFDGHELALKAWRWVLETLAHNIMSSRDIYWHDLKNIGYAWRQVLFFISVADDTEGLLETMHEELDDSIKDGWASRYIDALFLVQLEKAMKGEEPEIVLLGCPAGYPHPLTAIHSS